MLKRHLEGKKAETKAEDYLHKRGLITVAKNYRCKGGEIDIVMLDKDQLVFVEVRYRRNTQFGSAADSVTSIKQRRIITAAQHYLQHIGHQPACRFDVVGFDGGRTTWIRDAFQL